MSEPRRDPHAVSPVQLTHEEIQVLKDCRVNSLYYRGIPLGLLSCFVAKSAIDTGFFPRLKRWSRVVYIGVFGLGLFTGVASYKDVCFRKIMALENSSLKEQFLKYQRERGMIGVPSSEFASVDDENSELTSTLNFESETTDEFQSPLKKRMQERSQWDDLRQQRQQQDSTEKHSGLTYEDLRKRNRVLNRNQPIEEEQNDTSSTRQINLETYTPMTFSEDKSSKALDFSNDSNDRISLYRSDDAPGYEEKTTSKRRRNFPQRARKNEYGDDVE